MTEQEKPLSELISDADRMIADPIYTSGFIAIWMRKCWPRISSELKRLDNLRLIGNFGGNAIFYVSAIEERDRYKREADLLRQQLNAFMTYDPRIDIYKLVELQKRTAEKLELGDKIRNGND